MSYLAAERREFRDLVELVEAPTVMPTAVDTDGDGSENIPAPPVDEMTKTFAEVLVGSVASHLEGGPFDVAALRTPQGVCWKALLPVEDVQRALGESGQGSYSYESRQSRAGNFADIQGLVQDVWSELCGERARAAQEMASMFKSPMDVARQSSLFKFMATASESQKAAEAMCRVERQLQEAAFIRYESVVHSASGMHTVAWQDVQPLGVTLCQTEEPSFSESGS
jgi:hypothetical protein